jgi:hypothetical protein
VILIQANHHLGGSHHRVTLSQTKKLADKPVQEVLIAVPDNSVLQEVYLHCLTRTHPRTPPFDSSVTHAGGHTPHRVHHCLERIALVPVRETGVNRERSAAVFAQKAPNEERLHPHPLLYIEQSLALVPTVTNKAILTTTKRTRSRPGNRQAFAFFQVGLEINQFGIVS